MMMCLEYPLQMLLTFLSLLQEQPFPGDTGESQTHDTPLPCDSSSSIPPVQAVLRDLSEDPELDLVHGNTDSQAQDSDHLMDNLLDPQSQAAPNVGFPSGSTGAIPTHTPSGIPPGDVRDLWNCDNICLNDLKLTVDFINALQCTSLDDPNTGLSSDALERLRNPLRERPGLSVDKDTRLAIDLFLGNPSEITYETNRAAILRCFPDCNLPTYYKTNCLVADPTGIESIIHHMCVNSCIAYTGPFMELQSCPICSEPRYDQFRLEASNGKEKVPRQEFHTIPVGPQLQALY